MTSEDVIAVIDQLCDKLGLAVDSMAELVPELATWKIGSAGFIATVCLVCCVAAIITAVWAYRKATKITQAYNEKHKDEMSVWDYSKVEDYCWGCVICGAAAAILLIATFYNIHAIIGWIVAPNMKAIEYILSLM